MKKILGLSSVLLLSACVFKNSDNPVEKEVVETVETNVGLESIEVKERPVYHETETVLTDLIHTRLEVNFDWEKSRMNGIATISAKPHFYPSDSLLLDAKGMIIHSVKMKGAPLAYTYANDFLRIHLGKTYTRKDTFEVVIDYVACPEERETSGSAAITSDKGLYFINPKGENKHKMPQIWTQGETEASSVWFPTIDAPNAKTSQEIFITVKDKYTTLSNGRLVSSKKLPNGMRVDHWKQELPHAPYLFMMGIGEFKVVKDEYIRPDGTKMDVHYYVEPEWESSARDIFGETPDMIQFFSELLDVEYPWDKYHQIVVRDYVSGAMENTGAVIFGDFVYKNKRELLDGNEHSIIAHELFHHWFGDLVTCESWSNLTLNESFANYSQYLWDEHRYGLDEADYRAELEADGYFQSGQVQGFHDLVWFDYDDKEQMFDGHSYNKGGRILHMLRNHLGDEAFFAGMKRYLDRHKFQAAEFHQLRLAFEEVSGQDLNWFFNQWYLASGHPVLDFTHTVDTANQRVRVHVKQKQDLSLSPIYKIPVQMATYDEEGKQVHSVVIDELSETFVFPVKGELKGIVYDAQQMLLAKGSKDKTAEQYRFQYYHGDRYGIRKEGLLKGSKDSGEEGQQLVLDALSDSFWHIRLLAIGKVSKLRDGKKEKGIELLKNLAVNDPNSAVRAAALNVLDKYIDQSELLEICEGRIAEDPSYLVVSSALKKLGSVRPEQALNLAATLENEQSSKMIAGVAQLYASQATGDKYDFFAMAISGNRVQGFDKLGVLNSFTIFISRQSPEMAQKALEVYQTIPGNGDMYMNMFLPQNINYLITQWDAQMTALDNEVREEEAAGNPVLVQKARAKIKEVQAVKSAYESFKQELEAED